MSNNIVTTDKLNFRGSCTSIQFDAQRAKKDWQGRKIDETYTTKEEFAESLEGIAENADMARDAAKKAKANADASINAVNNIKKVIDAAAESGRADIDTILAASEVAREVGIQGALIPIVDNYHAQASNGNVDITNMNNDEIKNFLNAVVYVLRQVVEYGVFNSLPDGGIHVPQILDKYIQLARVRKLQAVSGNTNLTGAWEFPISLV